jgi:putative transposase
VRPIKYKIELKKDEISILRKILKKHSTPQNIAKRVKIILMAATGELRNSEIAEELNIRNCDITKWTQRWRENESIENCVERLQDKPRSGKPATITPEQWSLIMALACEKPENYGLPITQWSHATLTQEIIKQGIVKTISQTHVGDFLKTHNCNPIAVSTG